MFQGIINKSHSHTVTQKTMMTCNKKEHIYIYTYIITDTNSGIIGIKLLKHTHIIICWCSVVMQIETYYMQHIPISNYWVIMQMLRKKKTGFSTGNEELIDILIWRNPRSVFYNHIKSIKSVFKHQEEYYVDPIK